ncbi:hypothetical protein Salat_2438100 [Sesamum alatum]|uniref:Uncharacterized protein n=1 Tax=Sesamum alatum TaxID=300844 RepID=A0AAE1XYA4_9LAMI|nr:hypothetical protein Salat_2438100 [Sesamum alatum]
MPSPCITPIASSLHAPPSPNSLRLGPGPSPRPRPHHHASHRPRLTQPRSIWHIHLSPEFSPLLKPQNTITSYVPKDATRVTKGGKIFLRERDCNLLLTWRPNFHAALQCFTNTQFHLDTKLCPPKHRVATCRHLHEPA